MTLNNFEKFSVFSCCLKNYGVHCFVIFILLVMGLQNRNEYGPYDVTEMIWYFALLCAVIYDAWNTSTYILQNIDSSGIDQLQHRKYSYAKQAFSLRLATSVVLIIATWFIVQAPMEEDGLLFDFGPLNGLILFLTLFACYFGIFKILKAYLEKKDDSITY